MKRETQRIENQLVEQAWEESQKSLGTFSDFNDYMYENIWFNTYRKVQK